MACLAVTLPCSLTGKGAAQGDSPERERERDIYIYYIERDWQGRENNKLDLSWPQIQGTRTMPLVSHAFAGVTPAIFVIFVVFTGSEQQSPCSTG